uniref:Uncharacterized protein n=1 Tax=Anguilla anguilla TaxID=7936 RepID=A0A0E9QRG0_ANGAN
MGEICQTYGGYNCFAHTDINVNKNLK